MFGLLMWRLRVLPATMLAIFGLLPSFLLFAQGTFILVPDWPLPVHTAAGTPTGWNLIQVPGVAVNSRGHVLVLHRGAHPILEFDKSGRFVQA